MKFAFLIMGDFCPSDDFAQIHNGDAKIIGVSSIDEAAQTACRLQKEGVDCIELCGAFGEDGARKIAEVTGNKLPVGYVTHLPEQDGVYRKTFGVQ